MIRVLWIMPLCLGLAGCIGESEQARQQEAVEYQLEQHYAAQCADAGMLPGSIPFNDCVKRLEGAPVSMPTAAPAMEVQQVPVQQMQMQQVPVQQMPVQQMPTMLPAQR